MNDGTPLPLVMYHLSAPSLRQPRFRRRLPPFRSSTTFSPATLKGRSTSTRGPTSQKWSPSRDDAPTTYSSEFHGCWLTAWYVGCDAHTLAIPSISSLFGWLDAIARLFVSSYVDMYIYISCRRTRSTDAMQSLHMCFFFFFFFCYHPEILFTSYLCFQNLLDGLPVKVGCEIVVSRLIAV